MSSLGMDEQPVSGALVVTCGNLKARSMSYESHIMSVLPHRTRVIGGGTLFYGDSEGSDSVDFYQG